MPSGGDKIKQNFSFGRFRPFAKGKRNFNWELLPMNTITIDTKTRSCASIKTHGIFVYAQNKSTQVICVTVKKNSDPPVVWLPPELQKPEIVSISDEQLRQMLEEAELIQAYDITTEYALWKYTLCRLYPWFPKIPIKKLSCIAARASYLGMGYSRHDLSIQLNEKNSESHCENVKKKFVHAKNTLINRLSRHKKPEDL